LVDGRDRLWLGGALGGWGSWGGRISGADSLSIDKKLDDGNPNTGTIIAELTYSVCLTGTYPSAEYNPLSESNRGCMLAIRIY
jgi:hypothetical protein